MNSVNKMLWTPDYCRAFFANFMILIINNIMLTTFSLYVLSRGGTEMNVGICSYIQATACLLVRPMAGWFLDHRSRKTMLMVCTASMIFTQFGYVFAASILSIYFVRLLYSSLEAMVSVGIMTNAYDSMTNESFNDGVGYFGFSNSVANALAPAIGLWLWGKFGEYGIFGMIALAAAIAFLLLRKFNFHEIPPEHRTPLRQEKIRDIVYEKEALPASLLEGFIALGSGAINPYLAIFLMQRGVLTVPGLFFTFQACGTFTSRIFVAQISEKYGEGPIVYISAAVLATGIMGLTFGESALVVLAGAFLIGIGYGLTVTGFQIMSVRTVAPRRRGAASSTYYSGWDVFAAVGGLISGALLTCFTYQKTFCMITLLYPVYVLTYIFYVSKQPSAFKNYRKTMETGGKA